MSVSEVPQREDIIRRIAAAVAYLSYLVVPWAGPLVLFLLLGRRSKFVRFHSAQAFNMQITCTAGEAAGIGVTAFFSWMGLPVASVFVVVPVVFGIVAIVLTVRGAAQSLRGVMIRYPRWTALPLIR